MDRISEINRLIWEDVNLKEKWVVLYTRLKRGGHLAPRKITMRKKLHEILSGRNVHRDKSKRWVFAHRYFARKKGEWVKEPLCWITVMCLSDPLKASWVRKTGG